MPSCPRSSVEEQRFPKPCAEVRFLPGAPAIPKTSNDAGRRCASESQPEVYGHSVRRTHHGPMLRRATFVLVLALLVTACTRSSSSSTNATGPPSAGIGQVLFSPTPAATPAPFRRPPRSSAPTGSRDETHETFGLAAVNDAIWVGVREAAAGSSLVELTPRRGRGRGGPWRWRELRRSDRRQRDDRGRRFDLGRGNQDRRRSRRSDPATDGSVGRDPRLHDRSGSRCPHGSGGERARNLGRRRGNGNGPGGTGGCARWTDPRTGAAGGDGDPERRRRRRRGARQTTDPGDAPEGPVFGSDLDRSGHVPDHRARPGQRRVRRRTAGRLAFPGSVRSPEAPSGRSFRRPFSSSQAPCSVAGGQFPGDLMVGSDRDLWYAAYRKADLEQLSLATYHVPTARVYRYFALPNGGTAGTLLNGDLGVAATDRSLGWRTGPHHAAAIGCEA